jgi:hypothetical protein
MKKRIIRLLLLLPLLAVFHTARAEGEHWTWNPNAYSNNSIFTAVITIDGEEQRSDQLEIGAFYGETCRGSIICEYEPRKDRYFAYLIVNGSSGMVMNFRLWDHATESELDVTCDVTYTFEADETYGLSSDPYVFPFTTNPQQVIFNGTVNDLWSLPANWEDNALPGDNDNAIIAATCTLDQEATVGGLSFDADGSLTIPTAMSLTVGSITNDTPEKLVVADGGQLFCDATEGVFATIKKHVDGYGESATDHWCFIASPLVEGSAHNAVNGLVNEEGYDLYAFDQTEALEWRNFKDNALTLNPGEGYLYANMAETTLDFSGELNGGMEEVPLVYVDGCSQKGWNLIGNPYTYKVYASQSYYVLNEAGYALDPTPASQASAINPCTGIMVKAQGEGKSVTFGKTAPRVNQGSLRLKVAPANRSAVSDCAVVSFSADDALPKFVFKADQPKLYIPQENTEYAIVVANRQDEVAVNFKAAQEGSYTLCVNPADVSMEYLRLIDNLTGTETDLLTTSAYTFKARPTDYASRFRLVFKAKESNVGDDFAYFNGNEWVIEHNGEAVVQLVDLTGRMVNTVQLKDKASVCFDQPTGVYVLRLINAKDTKTQKIIIK